jgi:parallel beta-helix repeat protein
MSHRRLRFEPLEDRRVLATLWVDPHVAPTATIFSTISDAVAAAHNGDTVKVVRGTYSEAVDVNKTGLAIIGGQVRVSGEPTGPSIVAGIGFAFQLDANSTTVKNFTIEDATSGINTNAGFSGFKILHNTFLDNGDDIRLNTSLVMPVKSIVDHNTFTNDDMSNLTNFRGITTSAGASNVTVSNNVFQVNYTIAAIQIDGASTSTNVQILNNEIILQGIILANTTKAKIDGNSIAYRATAIHLAGAVTASEIAGNKLVGSNGSFTALNGIQLDEELVASPETADKITGNIITSRERSDGSLQGFDVGISVTSASQITISGNSVSFAQSTGINLSSSNSNTISSNTVTQSGTAAAAAGVGIGLLGSNNNLLSKNVVTNNENGGIRLFLSSSNTLKQNTANFNYGSSASGIDLRGANQNKLIGNTANFNRLEGIGLESANNNSVSGNTTNWNAEHGFRADSSAGNAISGNTANGNIFGGFDAFNMSNNNAFMKNTANNNAFGFNILADGTVFTSNTAIGNGDGIFVSGNSNIVKGNMASGNFGAGIELAGHTATASANIAKNNSGYGLLFSQLFSSTVSKNVVMNNDNDGIDVLSGCSGNTISGNTAMGNGQSSGFDLLDASTGSGTAGTANTWLNNKAQTRSPAGLL